MKDQKIKSKVNRYYTEKVESCGPNAQGVDWNGKESQYLRFEQLAKVIDHEQDMFSIIDFGCGYGEIINFFNQRELNFDYYGLDLSEKMLEVAKSKFNESNMHFMQNIEEAGKQDFLVASGVFNVKEDINEDTWKEYIEENLKLFDKFSKKGFSFNMLTSYSDKPLMKNHLFYADPLYFFNFCKKNFSRNVALLHDYNLYEFSIIVRK